MFIRRTRVHPLSTMPTPVARRRFIKENVLAICVPRRLTPLRERLSSGAALLGRFRETVAMIQVAEADTEALLTYPARLRQAASLYLATANPPPPIQVLNSEIEVVGRYDATLHRIERVDRPDPLADWLGPEAMPADATSAGPEYLMRLWENVALALGLPTTDDAAVLRRSLKQLAFLAEDYQASGLTRGADELSMLAMMLENRLNDASQPTSE